MDVIFFASNLGIVTNGWTTETATFKLAKSANLRNSEPKWIANILGVYSIWDGFRFHENIAMIHFSTFILGVCRATIW